MKFDIWRALTAIIIALLLAATWYLYTMNKAAAVTNTRLAEQKKSIERELESTYKQKQLLEAEFADAKKEKESLINKINDYDEKIKDMAAANDAKIEEMTAEINKLKNDLSQNEKELPQKDAEISSLKKAIGNARAKIAELNKKLSRAGPLAGTNGSVSLSPITVTPETKKVTGKVLEVNLTYGFVVIGAGSKDGVKTGDTLFISNDRELLGKVVVEKVRDSICVAKMLYKSLADTVKKGDLASNL